MDPGRKLAEFVARTGSLTGAPETVARQAGLQSTAQLSQALQSGISQGALRQTMTGRVVPVRQARPKTADGVRQTVADVAREMANILPRGTQVRTFRSMADLEGFASTLAQDGDRVTSRASGQAVDAFADRDMVYVADYAINPAGRIGHEAVHVLRQAELLTDKEMALLAERARKTGVFSKTRREQYERDYKQRFDDWARRLDEEAAAHLIEARINGQDFGRNINSVLDRVIEFFRRLGNALRGMGFQTTDDVVNALLSGEIARRQAVQDFMRAEDISAMAVRADAGPMMAMADSDTGRSMRRDLDALGYYSQALEAARSLKQAKGTPEQMLAQLKSAGVKDAEIEATGLDKFFAEKAKGSRPEPGARGPEAEATGASRVLAETREYKRAEADAVKAFNDDIEANKYAYFEDRIEYDDNGDMLPLDDLYPSLSGRDWAEFPAAAVSAVEAGARALGYDLVLTRGNSSSHYGTITINGRQRKVRVADHERQSNLHDGADYNISPESMTPFEFFERLITDARPKQKATAPSITRDEIVKHLEANRDKIKAEVKERGQVMFSMADLDRVTLKREPLQNWPGGFTEKIEASVDGGYVSARINNEKRIIAMGNTWLDSDQRSQGLGLAMYAKLVDYALENGYVFQSSNEVSGDAWRIYDALKRRGYNVIDKGNALERGAPRFTIDGKTDGGPMFSMADTTPPDQIARLTSRLGTLAQANGDQVPDLQARVSAALNTLTTLQDAAVERGVDVNGDGAVNVLDFAQANSGRAMAQITDLLGPERAAQIADDLQAITKDMPTDPQVLAQRINDVLDQVMPEDEAPRMAANDNQDLGPVSPVERDLYDIEQIAGIIEMIGVCR
jgi:putative component of toxin-antitoxin plasmid stabilization module